MEPTRLLTLSVSLLLLAACGSGGSAQAPAGNRVQEASLPQKLCDLVPQADAEKIMGKSLVEHRNDEWGCEYRDARGTTGTGLTVFRNALQVGDQCRMTQKSEPVSGVGDEACIAIGIPAGLYSTLVFGAGGQTFEVVAPGKDKISELSTALAKVMLSKLGA